jgi:hypothetical protein
VQVHDDLEPKDLLKEFQRLYDLTYSACIAIADCVMNCIDPEKNQMSTIAKGKLGTFAPESLIHKDVTADELVFTLLQFHVSNELYSPMARFHPKITDADTLVENCYKLVRLQGEYIQPLSLHCTQVAGSEPQENAARWRAWTYRAIEHHHFQLEGPEPDDKFDMDKIATAWAKDFASRITTDVTKKLVDMLDSDQKAPEMTEGVEKELMVLAKAAYLWRDKVNTRFFGHDFHPYLFPFDEKFDPDMMEVKVEVGRGRVKRPRKIIASVGLGLRSSVARGPDRRPKEVWQAGVPIATAAFM